MDKIEKQDPLINGNKFDIVPFNYIYCKKSSFLNGEFVKKDHHFLKKILDGFKNVDPELIELLNYSYKIENEDNIY